MNPRITIANVRDWAYVVQPVITNAEIDYIHALGRDPIRIVASLNVIDGSPHLTTISIDSPTPLTPGQLQRIRWNEIADMVLKSVDQRAEVAAEVASIRAEGQEGCVDRIAERFGVDQGMARRLSRIPPSTLRQPHP